MTAASFKRELEYSEALWAAQKRFLATIDPRLAEDFQPLSLHPYIAQVTYLHARLARDPDVRRHYDRFMASLKGRTPGMYGFGNSRSTCPCRCLILLSIC